MREAFTWLNQVRFGHFWWGVWLLSEGLLIQLNRGKLGLWTILLRLGPYIHHLFDLNSIFVSESLRRWLTFFRCSDYSRNFGAEKGIMWVKVLAKESVIFADNFVCAFIPLKLLLLVFILVAVVLSGCLFQSFVLNKVAWVIALQDRSRNQHVVDSLVCFLIGTVLTEQETVEVIFILTLLHHCGDWHLKVHN